jgi:hypothetical protein
MSDQKTNELKITCVERRHLSGALFMTYNALRALAEKNRAESNTDELVVTVSYETLANMNNRNRSQEIKAMKKLVSLGWIVRLSEVQERYAGGNWKRNRYRVLNHDEFFQAHPDSCPPLRYVKQEDGWRKVKAEKGRMMTKTLELWNTLKTTDWLQPSEWLERIAEARASKVKATVVLHDYGDVPPPTQAQREQERRRLKARGIAPDRRPKL